MSQPASQSVRIVQRLSCPTVLILLFLAVSYGTLVAGAPPQKGTLDVPASGQVDSPLPGGCGEFSQYTYSTHTDIPFEPGTTLLPGSRCDDCIMVVNMPFPVLLYGSTFTVAYVGSNGIFGFAPHHNPYGLTCIPMIYFDWEYMLFPMWDDWDMRPERRDGLGIYTSVTGTAPDRRYHVEWRACLYRADEGCDGRSNFEIIFYENSPVHPFDFVYGSPMVGGDGGAVGVYKSRDAQPLLYTQYSCGTNSLFPGLKIEWNQPGCLPPTITPTPTPEPPRCPGERFTDVCPGDYFYEPTLALVDLGVITGYNTSPPCTTAAHIPCFKPYNNVTRGQTAKIVSLAAGFNEPVTGQMFEDVSPGHTFYPYIQRLASRQIIGGYACGAAPAEPCVPPLNRPYFRPGNSVTRGQVSKITAESFAFTEPVSGQTFEDVPVGSAFYIYVERIAIRGIISGYPCGTVPSEPCVPPLNRPVFRPNNPLIRAQTTKIIYLAIQSIPTATTTAAATSTETLTPVPTPSSTTAPTNTPMATSTLTPNIAPTSTPEITPTPTVPDD
jgi:hypothetical protein